MATQKFMLINEQGNDPSEIIGLKEMGLFLKVIPDHLQRETYPIDHVVFIARFFAKTMKGGLNKDSLKETHFQLMNLHSEKRRLWDYDLFESAISYYCREFLSRSYNELAMIVNGKMINWDNDQYFD